MRNVLLGFPLGFHTPSDLHTGLKVRSTGRKSTVDKGTSGALPPEAMAVLAKSAGSGTLSSPFAAMGKSGVRHTFTFGIKEGGSPGVVCDMISGTAPADETKVLSLFIKVYDVGATHALLCAMPSLNADAKKLAVIYKMMVIEANDRDSAVKKMADALRRINEGT